MDLMFNLICAFQTIVKTGKTIAVQTQPARKCPVQREYASASRAGNVTGKHV